MRSAKERGHRHGEAFMLMTYVCRNCVHREVIWNSRDGVTPFGMSCPSCGQPDLLHSNWSGDVYAPDHKLHRGQRFWRDGTPDEAEAIMRRRIERMKESYPLEPGEAEKLIEAARSGTGDGHEFQKGWPMIDVHSGA